MGKEGAHQEEGKRSHILGEKRKEPPYLSVEGRERRASTTTTDEEEEGNPGKELFLEEGRGLYLTKGGDETFKERGSLSEKGRVGIYLLTLIGKEEAASERKGTSFSPKKKEEEERGPFFSFSKGERKSRYPPSIMKEREKGCFPFFSYRGGKRGGEKGKRHFLTIIKGEGDGQEKLLLNGRGRRRSPAPLGEKELGSSKRGLFLTRRKEKKKRGERERGFFSSRKKRVEEEAGEGREPVPLSCCR